MVTSLKFKILKALANAPYIQKAIIVDKYQG